MGQSGMSRRFGRRAISDRPILGVGDGNRLAIGFGRVRYATGSFSLP